MTPKPLRTLLIATLALLFFGALALSWKLRIANIATNTDDSLRPSGPVTIGLSIASYRESRWELEADLMADLAGKLGAKLLVSVADGDPEVQERQAKQLIRDGAQVLIVVANDAEKAAAIVEDAHEQGVKVIAYDRLIRNADLDYYLSFDNVLVGEAQARGVLDAMGGEGRVAYIGGSPTDNNSALVREGSFRVLQPKIDQDVVRVVLDKHVPDWDGDKAYQVMSEFLKNGGSLDGAVVANDGMAGGVIRALREQGLAGKVPVSGQDAELRACQDIVKGLQTVTVYKPLHKLAEEAVLMAIAVASGEQLRQNATVFNGKTYVMSRLLNVIAVNKANMDATVILDGFHTRDEVYGTGE